MKAMFDTIGVDLGGTKITAGLVSGSGEVVVRSRTLLPVAEGDAAILEAIKRAREMGTGVISLRGRMVDAPVVKRAARILKTAAAFGLVEVDLSDEVIYGKE